MDEARFDAEFDAIALVACRDIGRNREILWLLPPTPIHSGKAVKSFSKRREPIATLPIHPPFRCSQLPTNIHS